MLDDQKKEEICTHVFWLSDVFIWLHVNTLSQEHDQSKTISSLGKIHEGMVHILTRWNQHNMSSYGIWGGWQKWRKYDWKFLGRNMWIKKGGENEICNYG